MKARQANAGGSVPIFFISGKEGKKGLFFRSSSNEDYIDPELGKIHVEEGKDGKNIYVQYFQSLTGNITDVKVKKTFREMPGKGKVKGFDIIVEMDSDGTPIKIMFNFDSSYGRKFAQIFRNIKLKDEVTIKPYNFIPKPSKEDDKFRNSNRDPKKAVLGMNIFRGDSEQPEDAYKAYYDRDNMPNFETEGRDGPEYDSKAANNWLYKKFIEDVYHAFDHYEEEEKPEDDKDRHDDKYDPGNRKDYRDNMDADRKHSSRDDDRRSSRDDDRRSSRDDDDRKSSRDRDDDRRPSRDDDRRSSRDDDRRGDDDEYDREERRESRRSDNRSADDVPQRRQREEVKEMSKEEFEAEKRSKRDSGGVDKRDSRDDYSATGGMERKRRNDDNEDDLPF